MDKSQYRVLPRSGRRDLQGAGGLALAPLAVKTRRNQRRTFKLVELKGFEPLISVVRAPCAPRGWSHAKNAVRDHVRGQALAWSPTGPDTKFRTLPSAARLNHPQRETRRGSNGLTALRCVNRIYISGRHGVPAAMTVCQKSAARKATTIMRRIRPRVSRTEAVSSREVSRSGSLMRNYSVARQRANLIRH